MAAIHRRRPTVTEQGLRAVADALADASHRLRWLRRTRKRLRRALPYLPPDQQRRVLVSIKRYDRRIRAARLRLAALWIEAARLGVW